MIYREIYFFYRKIDDYIIIKIEEMIRINFVIYFKKKLFF